MKVLWRGLTLACGVCGSRTLFRKWGMFAMVDDCPRCGLHFERMDGHSLGAVAVNTMTSSALVLTVVALALVIIGTDASTSTLLLLAAPAGLIFPILFDPVSRTLWNAIELKFEKSFAISRFGEYCLSSCNTTLLTPDFNFLLHGYPLASTVGPVVKSGVHAGLSSRRSRVQIPSGPRSGSSVGRARA